MEFLPPNTPKDLRRRRLTGLLVAAITGAVLGLAWWLQPAAKGIGTHQQLGLPACAWPERFGIPCPTCGYTTSFALAAKGHFIDSFVNQPMAMIVALATGCIFVASLWSVATGRSIAPIAGRCSGGKFWLIVGVLGLLSWGYKIAVMRNYF
ncbi:MAG: DUF2752 domain-containing protein [Phycisphaerales bacterium]|nr:DUF2752 domain-containing protein [Phycisphaerales bacterium]